MYLICTRLTACHTTYAQRRIVNYCPLTPGLADMPVVTREESALHKVKVTSIVQAWPQVAVASQAQAVRFAKTVQLPPVQPQHLVVHVNGITSAILLLKSVHPYQMHLKPSSLNMQQLTPAKCMRC